MTLNELITFYTLTQAQDEYGTLVTTRTELRKAYAKVHPLSGTERYRSMQTEAQSNYRFWVHYYSDVTSATIIVWRGVDFNIRFIADNGPKEAYMYIDAERGVAN